MTLTAITLYELEHVRRAVRHTNLGRILGMLSPEEEFTSPKQGYFVGPLNSDKLIEPWEEGSKYGLSVEGIGTYPTSYYVDDSPEDFIRKYRDILEAHENKLAVFFTPIRKEDQDPKGGWRWHKWGEYIGEKTPEMEYIYDEPKISIVYVVHISRVSR